MICTVELSFCLFSVSYPVFLFTMEDLPFDHFMYATPKIDSFCIPIYKLTVFSQLTHGRPSYPTPTAAQTFLACRCYSIAAAATKISLPPHLVDWSGVQLPCCEALLLWVWRAGMVVRTSTKYNTEGVGSWWTGGVMVDAHPGTRVHRRVPEPSRHVFQNCDVFSKLRLAKEKCQFQ